MKHSTFLDILIENHQAQIAGYYNVDKTDEERKIRNAVIKEYSDLIAIYKSSSQASTPTSTSNVGEGNVVTKQLNEEGLSVMYDDSGIFSQLGKIAKSFPDGSHEKKTIHKAMSDLANGYEDSCQLKAIRKNQVGDVGEGKTVDVPAFVIEGFKEAILLIEIWHGKNGWEFYNQSPEMKRISAALEWLERLTPAALIEQGSGDMTAREYFCGDGSPLTLDKICTPEEREFLLNHIELYAKGKVYQAGLQGSGGYTDKANEFWEQNAKVLHTDPDNLDKIKEFITKKQFLSFINTLKK